MPEPDIRQISAAMRNGRWTDVERFARLQLDNFPRHENLLAILAISLHVQGRSTEAVAAYARLTDQFPASSVHWGNYATALREMGATEQAEFAYRKAARLDPRDPAPLIGLGLLLLDRRDHLAARGMLLDAFDLDRDLALTRIHAARACSLCQDFQGAEDLLKPWRHWLPLNDAPLQRELANLLLLMSEADGAQALLEDLLRLDPADAETKLSLASVYERMNRLDDAQVLVQSVIAPGIVVADPISRDADHVLANLMLRRGNAAAARSLLERTGPRNERDPVHYLKLAEAYDKLDERELALQALQAAHALQVQELKIAAPEGFLPDAPALPATIIDVSADAYRKWPKLDAPDARHSPVFIVGFPRSGTTLLEQMLDAHPGLQSMDENPFFNRLADKLRRHDPRVLADLGVLRQLDCDELRKRYLVMVSETVRRRPGAQLVDKNPLNMLWLPLIHRLYPAARHILAVRHPCDVILSCYMQNFRASILITASSTLVRLAHAYVDAMHTWLRHVDVLQPEVLVSRYEDLIADVAGQTRRIASFLEIDDAAPMMGFDQRARDKGYIATPSYSQVIEPVNRKGLNRWLRYREAFEPVLPIVEPMLRHWGYSTAATT